MRLTWREVPPGNGPAIDTSLTEAETDVLRGLVADAEVLEIGSAYGYSAVAMALAGARRVLAVDPHIQMASYETMQANLGFYGVAGRVEIWRLDSRVAMPRLADEGRKFDLIWIDGDHGAEMVEHDVTWARKLLREGGTLACHDYDEETCPGVKIALDQIFSGPGTLTDTLAVYGPGEW